MLLYGTDGSSNNVFSRYVSCANPMFVLFCLGMVLDRYAKCRFLQSCCWVGGTVDEAGCLDPGAGSGK